MVGAVPLVGDVTPVVSAGFVVEDNGVNQKLSLLKAGHAGIGSCKTLTVMLGRERLDEDGIGYVVVGNHDVLVAALCTDGESTCVVCVQATEWEFAQVDDVAFRHRGCCVICQGAAVWIRLCQLHVLARLCHVAFVRGIATRKILGCK